MEDLTVIGIDIAKNVFQIHGANGQGKKLLKKRVSREGFLGENRGNGKNCTLRFFSQLFFELAVSQQSRHRGRMNIE